MLSINGYYIAYTIPLMLSYMLDGVIAQYHSLECVTHTLVAEVSTCTLAAVVRWRSPPPPPSQTGTSNCVCQLSIGQKIVCMKKHYLWRWRGIKKVTHGGCVASGVQRLESVGWTAVLDSGTSAFDPFSLVVFVHCAALLAVAPRDLGCEQSFPLCSMLYWLNLVILSMYWYDVLHQ